MKELYEKGVATHPGPEPCVGLREEVGEASVGVRAGQDIEPRKNLTQGADAFVAAEGNRPGGAIASRLSTLRGLRPWHARKLIAGNRGGPVIRHGCDGAVAHSGNPKGASQW